MTKSIEDICDLFNAWESLKSIKKNIPDDI